MSSRFPLVALLVLSFVVSFWSSGGHPLLAQATPTLSPDLEARARALYKQFMCPVCPGETIYESQAPIAQDMRQIIDERLLAGDTNAQITAYFVQAYGESVLASPPRQGFGLAAWLIPPFGILLGGIVVYWVLRVLRRAASATPSGEGEEEPESGLDSYLAVVDTELGEDGSTHGPARNRA